MLFDSTTNLMAGNDTIATEALSFIIESAMQDTLTAEEISDFVANSEETSSAVREGVLLEKTIVKLDKKAKLSRAYKAAIFTIAKEKNDRDFKKLVTVWKMERALEQKLEKKYKNEAMKRAKQAIAAAGKSNSAVVKKVAQASNAKLK